MLEKIFKLQEHNTNVRTEVSAGIVTFMTMGYILVVQPSFMGAAGMDVGAVTAVTALLAGVFSIVMALYTNRPFAMAAAMGSNAFFSFTMVQGGLATWQQGLGMTFISGIVFFLLTIFGLREVIVKAIPKNVKLAIGAAVGFFIAQVGFKNGNLMSITDGKLELGDLTSPGVMLVVIGLFILVGLMARKIKGAVLISIVLITLIGIPMGITQIPDKFITLPPSIEPIAFKLDIIGSLKLSFFPIMFTFFVGDFFSTLGTVLGVSAKAGFLDENGDLPDINKPFLVDSIATMVGAVLGSTVVTTYIESASGIEAGGRTGLTSVSTGVCFLLALFVTPVVGMIPSEATAPALIIIGLLMISAVKDIDFSEFTEAFPAFATIIFTAFTASLSNGISIGIISYVFVKLVSGKYKELNIGAYVLSVLLLMYFII
ncbi:NCS2 family permease [Clostridium tarantellae]|uniref:NCS2 family permease n=1 Tax=Clostridium tarantellae TaxID=39493 RepID=A0A6I1MN30_9CLOT|nr:NCS2 family permease [Clostridium tarantellae]MPQ44370.1 NCS2 family permease [Clostridium tarantellae]